MEDQYLWDEDVDPKSLKVAELRKILLEHDISFGGHDKKGDLIKLFKENLEMMRENKLKEKELAHNGAGIQKMKKGRKKKRSSDVAEDVNARVVTGPRKSTRIGSANSSDGMQSPKVGKEVSTSSPFSDVNEFQQKPSRKRKNDERDGGDEEADAKPRKASRKKTSKSPGVEVSKQEGTQSEGQGASVRASPIAAKVQSKRTPIKAEHKSLVIHKFETSSDDSSAISTPTGKKILVFEKSPADKIDVHDFSATGKRISPDLSKLKVSPQFQLKLAELQNANSSPRGNGQLGSREMHHVTQARNDQSHDTENENESAVDVKHTISTASDKVFPASKKRGLRKKTAGSEDASATSTPRKEVPKPASSKPSPQSKRPPSRAQKPTSNSKEIIAEGVLDDVKNDSNDKSEAEHKIAKRGRFSRLMAAAWNLFVKVFLFLSIVVPILFALWYREQRILVGYCGHEINMPTFTHSDKYPILERFDRELQKFKPSCIPCPENAICYTYMNIKCKPEYAVTSSFFSLYGLFPVSDYCEKDSKKEKLVAEVVQKSLELLRTKNARIQCGECTDDTISGISEEELYQIFFESKAPWINEDEFKDIWKQVVKDLKNESEIICRQVSINQEYISTLEAPGILTQFIQAPRRNIDIQVDPSNELKANEIQEQEGYLQHADSKEYFRSISKKYIGIRCQFERQVYRTYQQFTLIFWSIIIIIVLLQILKLKLQRRFREQMIIEQLKSEVLEKLKVVAQNKSPTDPKFLSTVQLRDVLLSDVTNLKHKNHLWSRVVELLESNNTNVKSMLMEVHGEIMKCWEWVGPFE